jgi:predicted dehydrogenase
MSSVAIIGLGMIGLQHATIINALSNNGLRAICDKESLLIKPAKKFLGNVSLYTDYSDMLRKEKLDAVMVCTPIQSHESLAMDIMQNHSDLSLFVEKPLADSYEAALRMSNASQKINGITMVGFQKRFTGVFRKAKELLDKKALGELLFLRSYVYSGDILRRMEGWKFQKGSGGVAIDYSPHLLDLLLWYFAEPISLRSETKSFFSEAEDLAHVDVRYQDGMEGYIDICWSMRNFNPFEMMIEVHGTNGTLNVTDDRLVVYLDQDVPGVLQSGVHTFPFATLASPVPFLLTAPEFVLQDQYFLECVRKKQQPEQNFVHATKVNKIISMIQKGEYREQHSIS